MTEAALPPSSDLAQSPKLDSGRKPKSGRRPRSADSAPKRLPGRPRGAPPLIYDPKAHNEFVTGFRRRKEARRAEGKKAAKAAERVAIITARKEKRDIINATLARARGFELSDSENEEGSPDDRDAIERTARQSTTYRADDNDAVVTTSVTPIETLADTRFMACRPKTVTRASSDRQGLVTIDDNKASATISAKTPHTASKPKRKGHLHKSYTHVRKRTKGPESKVRRAAAKSGRVTKPSSKRS